MATLKEQLTTGTFTITLASLASGAWRQSNFVDNSSNLFDDVFIKLQAKTGATAAGTVDLWVYDSIDGGTLYSDGASGSDAAFTPTATPNIIFIGSLNTPTATTQYTSPSFSLAAKYGSNIPQRFGLIVHNTNGGALDATEGNFTKEWMGLTYQSV